MKVLVQVVLGLVGVAVVALLPLILTLGILSFVFEVLPSLTR
jgi:hypothetical protein